jgi:hypothetical protein
VFYVRVLQEGNADFSFDKVSVENSVFYVRVLQEGNADFSFYKVSVENSYFMRVSFGKEMLIFPSTKFPWKTRILCACPSGRKC